MNSLRIYLSASADEIFTISFTADQYAHVWIDHPDENIAFVADGRSIKGRPNSVTLART